MSWRRRRRRMEDGGEGGEGVGARQTRNITPICSIPNATYIRAVL
jgi:hypothetical protein